MGTPITGTATRPDTTLGSAPGNLPLDSTALVDRAEIDTFVEFAESRPDLTFLVTEIGCGIAGYTPADVAPLFPRVPLNVRLPESFVRELDPGR